MRHEHDQQDASTEREGERGAGFIVREQAEVKDLEVKGEQLDDVSGGIYGGGGGIIKVRAGG